MPIEEFLAFRNNPARQLLKNGSLLNFVFFHARPFRMDILAGYCKVVGISLRSLAKAGSCHHFRGVICPEVESIGAGVAV